MGTMYSWRQLHTRDYTLYYGRGVYNMSTRLLFEDRPISQIRPSLEIRAELRRVRHLLTAPIDKERSFSAPLK